MEDPSHASEPGKLSHFRLAQEIIAKGRKEASRQSGYYRALLFQRSRQKDNWSPLHFAVYAGLDNTTSTLLADGYDVQSPTKSGSTPLHIAAQQKKTSVVNLLLKNGADVKARDSAGQKALDVAYKSRNLEAARLLWQQELSTASEAEKLKLESVGYAAKHNNDALVWLLLEEGGDPNDEYRGLTALCWACAERSESLAALLLRYGASVSKYCTLGFMPLHQASFVGHEGLVIDLITQYGANPNCRDVAGRTPLHLAAEANDIQLAERLFQYGANTEAQDEDGRTPLHAAARKGSAGIVDLLLARGANPNHKDKKGVNPLTVAALKGQKSIAERLRAAASTRYPGKARASDTPLHIAAKRRNLNAVMILLDIGEDIWAQNEEGHTPLDKARACCDPVMVEEIATWAISRDYLQLTTDQVRSLLKLGANPMAQTNSEEEPKHCLLYHELVRVDSDVSRIELLLKHGARADMDASSNARDRFFGKNRFSRLQYCTPLAWLVGTCGSARDYNKISLLLKYGANPNAVSLNERAIIFEAADDVRLLKTLCENTRSPDLHATYGDRWGSGITVLHLAAFIGNAVAVQCLLACGADPSRKTASGLTPLEVALFGPTPDTVGIGDGTALPRIDYDGRDAVATLLLTNGLYPPSLRSTLLTDAIDRRVIRAVHLLQSRPDIPTPAKLRYPYNDKCFLSLASLIGPYLTPPVINTCCSNGQTPLQIASREPFPEVLPQLRARGARINALSQHGRTALHSAALFGLEDNVKALLALGADVALPGSDPILTLAASSPAVMTVLLKHAARRNVKLDTDAALEAAMVGGYADTVVVVRRYLADPGAEEWTGRKSRDDRASRRSGRRSGSRDREGARKTKSSPALRSGLDTKGFERRSNEHDVTKNGWHDLTLRIGSSASDGRRSGHDSGYGGPGSDM